MQFRTELPPLRMQGTVSHSTPLLMLGSCFTDNIGARLGCRLFDVTANPFGQLYNPASISAAARMIASGEPMTVADLEQSPDGLWHSFRHHGSFSGHDRTMVLDSVNRSIAVASEALRRADIAVLTLGTSRCYRLISSGEIVANCHKFPAARFERVDLDSGRSAVLLAEAVATLRSVRPGLKVILTVSPIRHLSDGFRENALSKARLLEATAAIENQADGVIYFPAFEIMTDDLRDYRFYAADMLHPSEVAADYIFDLFGRSFFSPKTEEIAKQSYNFVKFLRHRPLHPSDRQAHDAGIELRRRRLLETWPELERVLNTLMQQWNSDLKI